MVRDTQTGLYHEVFFNELLALKQKKCERSKDPVFLMRADISAFNKTSERQIIAKTIVEALSDTIENTDAIGWQEEGSAIGVMFTETKGQEASPQFTPLHIANECKHRLRSSLGMERYSRIHISWPLFPQTLAGKEMVAPVGANGKPEKNISLIAKRIIDIVSSLFALLLFAPLLTGIALWVRMTSEGPVLFKQERIGYKGKPFMLLKFRSMYANNDPSIHKKFVKNFISGGKNGDRAEKSGSVEVYKITNDPRVTQVGRFLRKTSMDELPQLINVLKGDMSLVGPRPPLMYEYEDYDLWHRHRVLDMKPGITGLWQVMGRSITTFDDMVRMDIKYIRKWSLWLDMRIILKTLVVVLMRSGGY